MKGVYKMTINKQHLHELIDAIEPTEFETLYRVLIRFVPDDIATPDEVEAIRIGQAEFERGETVSFNDVDWS